MGSKKKFIWGLRPVVLIVGLLVVIVIQTVILIRQQTTFDIRKQAAQQAAYAPNPTDIKPTKIPTPVTHYRVASSEVGLEPGTLCGTDTECEKRCKSGSWGQNPTVGRNFCKPYIAVGQTCEGTTDQCNKRCEFGSETYSAGVKKCLPPRNPTVPSINGNQPNLVADGTVCGDTQADCLLKNCKDYKSYQDGSVWKCGSGPPPVIPTQVVIPVTVAPTVTPIPVSPTKITFAVGDTCRIPTACSACPNNKSYDPTPDNRHNQDLRCGSAAQATTPTTRANPTTALSSPSPTRSNTPTRQPTVGQMADSSRVVPTPPGVDSTGGTPPTPLPTVSQEQLAQAKIIVQNVVTFIQKLGQVFLSILTPNGTTPTTPNTTPNTQEVGVPSWQTSVAPSSVPNNQNPSGNSPTGNTAQVPVYENQLEEPEPEHEETITQTPVPTPKIVAGCPVEAEKWLISQCAFDSNHSHAGIAAYDFSGGIIDRTVNGETVREDLGDILGAPIVAAYSGYVTFYYNGFEPGEAAYETNDQGQTVEVRTDGNTIAIASVDPATGNTFYTIYSHLLDVSPTIASQCNNNYSCLKCSSATDCGMNYTEFYACQHTTQACSKKIQVYVEAGTVIGWVDNTGYSSGSHLHIERAGDIGYTSFTHGFYRRDNTVPFTLPQGCVKTNPC